MKAKTAIEIVSGIYAKASPGRQKNGFIEYSIWVKNRLGVLENRNGGVVIAQEVYWLLKWKQQYVGSDFAEQRRLQGIGEGIKEVWGKGWSTKQMVNKVAKSQTLERCNEWEED